MSVEKSLIITNDDLPDINGALSWIVQLVDGEKYKDAEWIMLHVETIERLDDDGETFRKSWAASVTASVPE